MLGSDTHFGQVKLYSPCTCETCTKMLRWAIMIKQYINGILMLHIKSKMTIVLTHLTPTKTKVHGDYTRETEEQTGNIKIKP